MLSAPYRSLGAKASKWHLARAAGRWSSGTERVVLGDLARLTPRRPRSLMNRSTVHSATRRHRNAQQPRGG